MLHQDYTHTKEQETVGNKRFSHNMAKHGRRTYRAPTDTETDKFDRVCYFIMPYSQKGIYEWE